MKKIRNYQNVEKIENYSFYVFMFILLIILIISLTSKAQVSQIWASRYDFSGNTDKSNAMTVDAAGNVYVTGASRSSGIYTEDIATNKYNSSGTLLWSRRFAG